MELKQFPHKNQVKVFLRLSGDRDKAKMLFSHLFRAYDLPFSEHQAAEDSQVIRRKMRCYLVLPEQRMVQLSEKVQVEN